MLQDIPTPTLHEASSRVLETERLTLRRPTLADVKAIARLANDRRIAENTRRLPHPYSRDHAIEFIRATANDRPEAVFLIENNFVPIGMVGVDWREPDAPELGY
jgi:RimJ/RimL family protein N-acetyltransferase